MRRAGKDCNGSGQKVVVSACAELDVRWRRRYSDPTRALSLRHLDLVLFRRLFVANWKIDNTPHMDVTGKICRQPTH